MADSKEVSLYASGNVITGRIPGVAPVTMAQINVGTPLGTFTVATLPSAVTSGAGAQAFVTDANTTIILGIGTTVAAGGANKVPVYSDGTNWIIG